MSAEKFGRYLLDRRLGQGGMAEVFSARLVEGRFEKPCAVKRILPELAGRTDIVTMFADEAAIAARLAHPNVASIFDFGDVDGRFYIAMELVDGPSLGALSAALGKRGEPFPIAAALDAVAQAARGLAHAHAARGADGKALALIHRDVSPQNLLVGSDGRVRVTDFGIARARDRVFQTSAGGAIRGKVGFIAPEVLRGDPYDQRIDQYALGVVLFETITGTTPFAGENDLEQVMAALRAPLVAPSRRRAGVTREVDAFVLRLMDREPEQRFATMTAVADAAQALGAALGDAGATLADVVAGQRKNDAATADAASADTRVRAPALHHANQPATQTATVLKRARTDSLPPTAPTETQMRAHPSAPRARPSREPPVAQRGRVIVGAVVAAVVVLVAVIAVRARTPSAPIAVAPIAAVPIAVAPIADAGARSVEPARDVEREPIVAAPVAPASLWRVHPRGVRPILDEGNGDCVTLLRDDTNARDVYVISFSLRTITEAPRVPSIRVTRPATLIIDADEELEVRAPNPNDVRVVDLGSRVSGDAEEIGVELPRARLLPDEPTIATLLASIAKRFGGITAYTVCAGDTPHLVIGDGDLRIATKPVLNGEPFALARAAARASFVRGACAKTCLSGEKELSVDPLVRWVRAAADNALPALAADLERCDRCARDAAER